MITPEAIRIKATALYPRAIAAWLAGDPSFFPRRLPTDLRVPKHVPQPELIRQVAELRDGSKAQLGYGYTVRYEQVNKRSHGDNLYPAAIELESLEDLLKLIRKQGDFQKLTVAVDKIRRRLPQLENWLASQWKRLLPLTDALDDLISVTEYVRDTPRPDCYVRELPLPVSSKLIEQNKPLLRDWFDRVLPEQAIDYGALKHFERRYGFRYPRQHILLRVLDPTLRRELGLPCLELSMPASDLAQLPVRDLQVMIVENKINLLTLPETPRGIACGGLGNNLAEFQRVQWLAEQTLYYWGDIDVDGLLILARFRRLFPHTISWLMDAKTLLTHRALWTQQPAPAQANRPQANEPAELQPAELEALRVCRDQGVRLEQEHIPQSYVNAELPSAWAASTRGLAPGYSAPPRGP